MTHTQGPWRACKDGACACGQIWGADHETVVARAYGVADLEDFAADCVPARESQAANARLISASPALLAALTGLVEIIDKAGLLNLSHGVQLGPTSWYMKACDRLDAAREAIERATPAVSGGLSNSETK